MTDQEAAFDVWWKKSGAITGDNDADLLETWAAACAWQQERDADQFFRLREENKVLAEQILSREDCWRETIGINQELGAQVERYREALERIKELHRKELTCDATDFDCVEDAYSAGSNNAWCETTEMAIEALRGEVKE